MKNKNHIIHIITSSAVFVSLGVLLPQVFHLFGAAAGQTFLPMHIPVLIAGLVEGPICAGVAGIFSPILSFLVTGMPSFIKMPFMCAELFTYGVTSALFDRVLKRKKLPNTIKVYISLVLSQICGRIVNLLCVFLAVRLFGISHPAVNLSAALLSVPTGFIGIVIQLVFIPPVALRIKNTRK